MGVLDQQSIRSEIGNRRLGRRRLEARLRDGGERRRPARGARPSDESLRTRVRRRDRGSVLGNALAGLGRVLVVAALVPVQLGLLLLRPRDFVARVRALPARMESGTRRLRMASRDPETRAGRLWDTAVLSAHFLREEVTDMQDGFPSREELLADIRGGAGVVRGGVERMLERAGVRPTETPLAPLERGVGVGLIAGTVVVGLFMAGHGALDALSQSDQLVLSEIRVEGASRTAERTLLGELAFAPGDRLLQLDTTPAATALQALPWVAEAAVAVDLRERAVVVRVVEHRPALVLAHDRLLLVDDEGIAFKPLEAGDPGDLPIVTGVRDLDPASEAGRGVLTGALEVLHSLSGSGAVGRQAVSELRYEGEGGWSLVTREGLPIRLGRQDFSARLSRLERAVQRGGLPLTALASIDLGLRDRLVVVPKKTKTAKRTVAEVVKTQPTPPSDRARHLERVRRTLGTAGGGLIR